MDPPVMLDYQPTPPPPWRKYGRLGVKIALLSLLLAGLGWLGRFALQARDRYRAMKEYEAGHAALANYTIPAGTVMLDPVSGPMFKREYFKKGNRSGWTLQPTFPRDALVEHLLLRMNVPIGPGAMPFVGDRQTVRGPAFVNALVDGDSFERMPTELSLIVFESSYTPGSFPDYQYRVRIFTSCLWFSPSKGRQLPIILAATPDANPSSWTLRLRLEGKDEWLRVDHSTYPPTRTASFGAMSKSEPAYLTY